MAKQVIWSLVAKKQLKEAFQILKLKNGNNEVGEVLYVQLQNILHRISMNPFIGQTTEIENIRYIKMCIRDSNICSFEVNKIIISQ